MKENFGFIERADVVKEIFFHFSESKGLSEDTLQLGDDVEFNIQTRNVSFDIEIYFYFLSYWNKYPKNLKCIFFFLKS